MFVYVSQSSAASDFAMAFRGLDDEMIIELLDEDSFVDVDSLFSDLDIDDSSDKKMLIYCTKICVKF